MKTTEYILYKSRMKNNYTNRSVELKNLCDRKVACKIDVGNLVLFMYFRYISCHFISLFFVIVYLFPFVLCNVRFSYLPIYIYCIIPRYVLNAFWTYSDKMRICNSSFTSHLLLFCMSFYWPNQHW